MRTGTSDKVECMEEGIVGKKLSFEDMRELIQVSGAKYGNMNHKDITFKRR